MKMEKIMDVAADATLVITKNLKTNAEIWAVLGLVIGALLQENEHA